MRIFFFLFPFLLFASCTPKFFSGMERTGKVQITRGDLYPVFGNADTVTTFNMQIEYKDNNFAGMLVVSEGERAESTRLIFTSYFGMTVFDFEMTADSFIVNRCLEQMNKKMVLSVLEKDFRSLFLCNIPPSVKAVKYENDSLTGYELKATDGKGYYLVDNASKQLRRICRPGCLKSLQIDFEQYRGSSPVAIGMAHPKMGLKLRLDIIQ